MKSEKVLWVLIIVIVLALGLLGAYVVMEANSTGKNIQTLKDRVDGFQKGTAALEGKMNAGDTERKNLASKIEGLSKDIQALQSDVKDLKTAKETQVSVTPQPPESSVTPASQQQPVSTSETPAQETPAPATPPAQ